jgi:hypothetical protein
MSGQNGHLSEPEAWREIARRIADGETKMPIGLCHEAQGLAFAGMCSSTLAGAMIDRACDHAVLSNYDRRTQTMYAYPPGKQRGARVLAALWLALEAEEEAE